MWFSHLCVTHGSLIAIYSFTPFTSNRLHMLKLLAKIPRCFSAPAIFLEKGGLVVNFHNKLLKKSQSCCVHNDDATIKSMQKFRLLPFNYTRLNKWWQIASDNYRGKPNLHGACKCDIYINSSQSEKVQ